MLDDRYLLEFEDKIERGVEDLLVSELSPRVGASLWQNLGVDPQRAIFVLGIPKHRLVDRLQKDHPCYHAIQTDSDVDVLAISAAFDGAGRLVWPPIPNRIAAVEVKAAYALVEPEDGVPTVIVHGLTEKKLKHAVEQCESLLLMGFDQVSLLVGIATEPQSAEGSQAWMDASSIGFDAFFKIKPVLESLPVADFGVAAYPIGAIGGPLPFVSKDEIPKGKHPVRVDPSKVVHFRKIERFAGAGCVQLIRRAIPNSRRCLPDARVFRQRLDSHLANELARLPAPVAFPAVLRWQGDELRPVRGFPPAHGL